MYRYLCKLPTKYSWHLLVIVVLLVQLACIGYLAHRVRSLDAELGRASQRAALLANSAQNAALTKQVVVAPAENAVYIPELRLKLPLNDASLLLTYSLRNEKGGDGSDEADVSTLALAAAQAGVDQAIYCTAGRIKIEDSSNPYNPHETNVASVRLADGRTLQAYAFSHSQCAGAFREAQVDSSALMAVFKNAKSY